MLNAFTNEFFIVLSVEYCGYSKSGFSSINQDRYRDNAAVDFRYTKIDGFSMAFFIKIKQILATFKQPVFVSESS